MAKNEKKHLRQQLRQQRLAVLEQINQLEAQSKELLKIRDTGQERLKIKNEIQALGKKLQRLVVKPVADKELILDVETYINLKLRGHTDKEIGDMAGQNKSYVDRWKTEQGITKKHWEGLMNA